MLKSVANMPLEGDQMGYGCVVPEGAGEVGPGYVSIFIIGPKSLGKEC